MKASLSTESSDDASPSNQPSTCVEKLQANNLTDVEISSVNKSSSSLSRLDWALLVEAEDTRSFLEESSSVRVESPVVEVSEATPVLDQACDNGSRSCTTYIDMMKDAWKSAREKHQRRREGAQQKIRCEKHRTGKSTRANPIKMHVQEHCTCIIEK